MCRYRAWARARSIGSRCRTGERQVTDVPSQSGELGSEVWGRENGEEVARREWGGGRAAGESERGRIWGCDLGEGVEAMDRGKGRAKQSYEGREKN